MGKYYVVTMTACILLLIGMTFHVQTNSILDEVAKSRFSMTFMGIATAITLGMMGFFLDGCLFPPFFHVVVTLMEFSLTPMLSVLLSIACGVRKQAIPIGVLMVIHAIIELVLVPFGKVFYIDSSGLYHRGPWYNLYIGAYFISFGYLFVFFFLLSKHFQKRDIKTLISGGLVVAASLIPSLIDGQIKTAFLGVTLLSVIFFVYYEGLTQQDLSTELEEQNKHVRSMQEKVIIGVADVIESRDDSTGTHIKNTADYVERLSKKALERGIYPDIIDKHFVEMVIRAAPMHDLGKIAIPDAILKKPGPLTREEFEIMKTHAPKGGQMVAQILEGVTDEDYTRIAFEVANYHHEKWDGTGYPDRLAGDAIPLSARIMALDDVYDALTMERVYKKAFPKDVALSIIKAGIGTQFDPLLGPIFVELMEGKDAEGDEASSASDRADRYQGKNRRWRRWSLKRIALTGLLSGTLLILMLCLILGVPVWESSGELAPGEASQWMAPLSDDLSLSQIHIPGTHDSASYYVRLPYFLRCQNTEIADQLLAGFRYLDLRLRSEKGRIILCHGFGTCRKEKNPFSQELTLEDVLEQVYDFLEDNPTETVVIAAKAERDEAEAIDIEDAFQRQIKEHPQRWLITQTLPTLGEARGRVVLLRRYEDVLNLGEESGIYAKWEQQTSEVPLEEAMTEYDCAGLHLFVQDRFCYNVEGKLSLIAAGLKQASEIDPKDSLRIHFCNTTGIRRISHPKTVSATINEQVKGMEFLGDFGWVIFDYGTPKLAKWIYSTNQVS